MLISLKSFTGAFCVLAVLGAASAADAAGWGTLTGKYVFDGSAPALAPLVKKGDPNAKDPTVCAAEDVPDESLVIDAESKGIKDIVVYLRKAPSAIHPDLKASQEKEVVFDQKGCRYIPHVLHVRTDQQVRCISNDAAPHNVHVEPFTNKPQNFVVSASDTKGTLVPMPLAESRPTPVKCDIHSWMKGIWIVTDHPYVAITKKDGSFTIENLPEGKHTFTVWHDKSGYVEAKLEVEIKNGKVTDLGTVKVPAAKFAK